MIILMLLPVMGLQLWLCFRVKKLFFRLLPLVLALVLVLGGFGALLLGGNVAATCVLAMLAGIVLLLAVGLCWLIYGIMRLAERSKYL